MYNQYGHVPDERLIAEALRVASLGDVTDPTRQLIKELANRLSTYGGFRRGYFDSLISDNDGARS